MISGFSAGARSVPNFDWVRNFVGALPESDKEDMRYEAASLFALFWNMCRVTCPAVVVEDFDNFISDSNIYRMDVEAYRGAHGGEYTVKYGEESHTFTGAEMAPPQGVFAQNYAR